MFSITRRTLMLIVAVLIGLAIFLGMTHSAGAQSSGCNDLPCITSVSEPSTASGTEGAVQVGFSNGAVIQTYDGQPSGGKVQSYERTGCWFGWCSGVHAVDINGFDFSGDYN